MEKDQRTHGSEEKAREMALAELRNAKIDPNSASGKEFLFRARAFGIMGVQPPRTDIPTQAQTTE